MHRPDIKKQIAMGREQAKKMNSMKEYDLMGSTNSRVSRNKMAETDYSNQKSPRIAEAFSLDRRFLNERPLTRQLSYKLSQNNIQHQQTMTSLGQIAPSTADSKRGISPGNFRLRDSQEIEEADGLDQSRKKVSKKYQNRVFPNRFVFEDNLQTPQNQKTPQVQSFATRLSQTPQEFQRSCQKLFRKTDQLSTYSQLPELRQKANPTQEINYQKQQFSLTQNKKQEAQQQSIREQLGNESKHHQKQFSYGWQSVPSMLEICQRTQSQSQGNLGGLSTLDEVGVLASKKIDRLIQLQHRQKVESGEAPEQSLLAPGPQRVALILRSDYFDICNSKNSLQYCYSVVPRPAPYSREKVIQQQFRDWVKECADLLKFLVQERIYVYLKDGKIINSHLEIPESETTLVFSVSPAFKGVESYSNNRGKLRRVIQKLETPLLLQKAPPLDGAQARFADETIKIKEVEQLDASSFAAGLSKEVSNQQEAALPASTDPKATKGNTFNSFEKQVGKKYKPLINSIIQALNVQKVIREEEDDGDTKDESSEYIDYNEECNLDSEQLEDLLRKISKKKASLKETTELILSQSKNQSLENSLDSRKPSTIVYSKKFNPKNNVEYLEHNDVLIKTREL